MLRVRHISLMIITIIVLFVINSLSPSSLSSAALGLKFCAQTDCCCW